MHTDANQSKRERLNISVSSAFKQRLEALIPERQRAQFAEQVMDLALQEAERQRAFEALDNLPSYSTDSQNSVDVLRQLRRDNSDRVV